MKYNYKPKLCEKCEKKYSPNTGIQIYCSVCGEANRLRFRREANRRYYIKNKGRISQYKKIWFQKRQKARKLTNA